MFLRFSWVFFLKISKSWPVIVVSLYIINVREHLALKFREQGSRNVGISNEWIKAITDKSSL